jgi:hypothetical protein
MIESRILEAIMDSFQKLVDEIWEWRMLTTSSSMLELVFKPPVMDQLQTSGELQDKTSFIDPSTGVDLLKGCSPDYLLL